MTEFEILIQDYGSCWSRFSGRDYLVLIIIAIRFRRRRFDQYCTCETHFMSWGPSEISGGGDLNLLTGALVASVMIDYILDKNNS